jgi:ATP-dependent helicase/nuclease subunit B
MTQPGGAFYKGDTSLSSVDFSALRVIVPAFEHAQLLTMAMSNELDGQFIPPRINTMSGWLAMQLPLENALLPNTDGVRLMTLYAQLREHAWLKKLFSARKNTDLLPLAQTLITLSDELTQAMLPLVLNEGMERVGQVWADALAAMPSQPVLSDEAQLVWQIWTSQLDGQDTISLRFQQMLQLAENSTEPLLWLSPTMPEGLDHHFLTAFAKKNPVQVISLDWRAPGITDTLRAAWQEIIEGDSSAAEQPKSSLNHISTIAADSLEQEAQLATQTILDWLQQGKSNIALIAQDRIVARRIRALLERAQVYVSDETGWKLSTTRAAAALAAWFDVVATRADTVMLLDLIKSPYFDPACMADFDEKSTWVMAMELALRSANVDGTWEAIISTLKETSSKCVALAEQLHGAATRYSGRKKLSEWLEATRQTLEEFGMLARWQEDAAGLQVVQLLEQLNEDCASMLESFSFSEWRVFINMQLESTSFRTEKLDERVVMLPLNGARLRSFDAVLMAGCDAAHLPSQPKEVLFFTNAVRRECGLITREQRQRQQLRDFAELLLTNSEVVLSWQRQQRGEDNPVSPWIERLNLCLQRAGMQKLATRPVQLKTQTLPVITAQQPRPSAPQLQPTRLSASGYNSFLACPYQFFATRMLGLSALDTLSDMPEKRDYGAWLHAILKTYHDTLRTHPNQPQEALLREISDAMFSDILQKSPAALGFYMRWKKVIPAYIAWSGRHAEAGWQFEMGEVWLEKNLDWNGGSIQLRGQIDRIDKNGSGEFAVLDYKTNPVGVLKNKLYEAEDQQLPFYGLLAEQEITSAHYVALDMSYEKLDDVVAENYSDWQVKLKESIIQNMKAIGQGAELPAQGVSQVCQYCEVRGMCRKGAW